MTNETNGTTSRRAPRGGAGGGGEPGGPGTGRLVGFDDRLERALADFAGLHAALRDAGARADPAALDPEGALLARVAAQRAATDRLLGPVGEAEAAARAAAEEAEGEGRGWRARERALVGRREQVEALAAGLERVVGDARRAIGAKTVDPVRVAERLAALRRGEVGMQIHGLDKSADEAYAVFEDEVEALRAWAVRAQAAVRGRGRVPPVPACWASYAEGERLRHVWSATTWRSRLEMQAVVRLAPPAPGDQAEPAEPAHAATATPSAGPGDDGIGGRVRPVDPAEPAAAAAS